ncbi:hypothetical protein CYMTET_53436 [Cymbomonas tetramitiformis]|uniref:NADPH:adrenodoxin oxidoreductase, mitochondrial n=1 Tax=Cymbomonas tetramitiformis TaxID=36881 RepID=A0AAE0BI52_9CHLO|nr:hypothetical protein CYMTET_53436 [Cymbomonas tetramitiformis]
MQRALYHLGASRVTGQTARHLLPWNNAIDGSIRSFLSFAPTCSPSSFPPILHSFRHDLRVRCNGKSFTRNLSDVKEADAGALTSHDPLHFCVVGSGPAGFYTADKLLSKFGDHIQVDIMDRLPTPFGLVRSGVAPDHPGTKAVVNRFTQIMEIPVILRGNVQVRVYSTPLLPPAERGEDLENVDFGKDISLEDLQCRYHGVVLAYGTESDRALNVPGEDLAGVWSARELVWWYNGHPDYSTLPISLEHDTAVIFGLGNVAVDCARVLLREVDDLAVTDMASHAVDALRKSQVRRVVLFGRRGPAQAAFTPKELREILGLPGVKVVIHEEDLTLSEAEQAHLKANRISRRVHEVLSKAVAAASPPQPTEGAPDKELHLRFFRSPAALLPGVADGDCGEHVTAVRVECTQVVDGRAVGTGEFEEIEAGLVLRSIGYKGEEIAGVPFDTRSGTVPNSHGRVHQLEDPSATVPGLYTCGWLKRGPSGIIGTNLVCAEETAAVIAQDMVAGALPTPTAASPGHRGLVGLLSERGVASIALGDWQRINHKEVERGAVKGKPRDKIVHMEDLMEAATC